jgi:hypothetical protein
LPTADLHRVAQVILTGGAAQPLDEQVARRLVNLLAQEDMAVPLLQIDRRYQLWLDGITWISDAPD